MMKIYVVQDLNYDSYELVYVGTDKERANNLLKNHHSKYIRGCIWEKGTEIEFDLREFV